MSRWTRDRANYFVIPKLERLSDKWCYKVYPSIPWGLLRDCKEQKNTKHRLLTVTYAVPEKIPFQIKILQTFPGEENLVRFSYNRQFIIEDGAVLGHVLCNRPITPAVNVDRNTQLKIAFAEPQVVAGQDLLIFLDNAVDLVENVIHLADRLVVRLYRHLAISNPNTPVDS